MSTIDDQIEILQRKKAEEQYKEHQKIIEQVTEKGKTLHNRFFIKFDGASMVGSAYWDVIYIKDSRILRSGNDIKLELYGEEDNK